ncbi:MAG: hypothetical protein ACXVI1_02150, partial [Halobacteriota archaeon]
VCRNEVQRLMNEFCFYANTLVCDLIGLFLKLNKKLTFAVFKKKKKHLKLVISCLCNETGLSQLSNSNHSFPLLGIHIPARRTCSNNRVA